LVISGYEQERQTQARAATEAAKAAGVTTLAGIAAAQFGSRPGSPVEECVRVVQSCRLYIGVFGMRYGTVPEGHEWSMTHIEYDEAQRLGLPSLIYIFNENHPIPAKDVETGPGAEKLQTLKEHLKKRHTVSFFTTPEDLQSRIMHDVPAQLEQMGVEVTDGLTKAEEVNDHAVLKAHRWMLSSSALVMPPLDLRMTA
jgi:Domain of unknown function (DUF4062)